MPFDMDAMICYSKHDSHLSVPDIFSIIIAIMHFKIYFIFGNIFAALASVHAIRPFITCKQFHTSAKLQIDISKLLALLIVCVDANVRLLNDNAHEHTP